MRYGVLLLLAACGVAQAQLITVVPGLARSEGIDAPSNIRYTRLFLTAVANSADKPDAFDLSRPTMTAQCSQMPSGKQRFEIFVNFGGVTDSNFYPPFVPTQDQHFPPTRGNINLTMNFLGYTKVKPFKRQFEKVEQPEGQLLYKNPGSSSSNLEEFAWFIQMLRALPTLRLTDNDRAIEFLTTPLLAQLQKEPLCKASGL
jgi:hypothetical protein